MGLGTAITVSGVAVALTSAFYTDTKTVVISVLGTYFSGMIVNPDFRVKTKKQKYFCMEHYQMLLEYAKNKLDKKKFEEFYSDVSLIQEKYLDKIIKDVSWFAKKFDYRYDSEPWYDSRDAVERAIKLLSGK